MARLLRLLERAGERPTALQAYEQFARTLQRDLGVEPGPELRGLVQELRARRPTPAAAPSQAPAPVFDRPASHPPPPPPAAFRLSPQAPAYPWRSEERRVGKECRSRWS